MGLIKRLFGNTAGSDTPEPAQPSHVDTRTDSRPMELDAQVATRRELLRVLTRDTQRFAGLPEGGIEPQVLLELGRDGQTLMHLRLVVKHWNDSLLKYHMAFQRRLMVELERFEPGAREWLLSITWQYLEDDQTPYLDLPDPATWGAAINPPGGPQPMARAMPSAPTREDLQRDEMREDLARLFAVRDANLARSGADANTSASAGAASVTPPQEPDRYHRKA